MKEDQKIVIYQTEDGKTQIDVRLENETVWLTQAQMAELFEKTPQNITMHIGNAYKEGELERESTCKEYLQVQQEGKRKVSRRVKYYDLLLQSQQYAFSSSSFVFNSALSLRIASRWGLALTNPGLFALVFLRMLISNCDFLLL